jgi:hypothetical protein
VIDDCEFVSGKGVIASIHVLLALALRKTWIEESWDSQYLKIYYGGLPKQW